MIVISHWKFTLGGGVILDYGSRMPDEVKLPQANGVDVVMSPDSNWPLLLDTGNSVVKIRFSALVPYATDKEARWSVLQHLATRAVAGIQDLKIEVYGYTDRYATFAQAKVTEFEPGMYMNGREPLQMRGYLLECSNLTLTGP